MKTTLEVPDDLFRQAKARAALEGIKLKDLVARALRHEVHGASMADEAPPSSKGGAEQATEAPFARQRVEFPLLKPGKRPIPYLTNALLEEVFAEEDSEYYGRFVRR